MYTFVETPTFQRDADKIWTEEERSGFCTWLASDPEVGKVISGSGGCRKVRWSRPGSGKRGGVRVVYYNQLDNGIIWLLVIYAKSVRGNIPTHILKSIREAIENE